MSQMSCVSFQKQFVVVSKTDDKFTIDKISKLSQLPYYSFMQRCNWIFEKFTDTYVGVDKEGIDPEIRKKKFKNLKDLKILKLRPLKENIEDTMYIVTEDAEKFAITNVTLHAYTSKGSAILNPQQQHSVQQHFLPSLPSLPLLPLLPLLPSLPSLLLLPLLPSLPLQSQFHCSSQPRVGNDHSKKIVDEQRIINTMKRKINEPDVVQLIEIIQPEMSSPVQPVLVPNHQVRKTLKSSELSPFMDQPKPPIFYLDNDRDGRDGRDGQDDTKVFIPDAQFSAKVEKYDRECYLDRNWASGEFDHKISNFINPLSNLYIFICFVKSKQWPLSETRYIEKYDEPARKISDNACFLYEKLGLSEYYEPVNFIFHLLLWCIYSMHTYGIIRPLIFSTTCDFGEPYTSMCAYKFKRGRNNYITLWPFRTDEKNIIMIHNNTKCNKYDVTSIIQNLNKNPKTKYTHKQLEADIPRWFYNTHTMLGCKK
jgi:hypothetical protein